MERGFNPTLAGLPIKKSRQGGIWAMIMDGSTPGLGLPSLTAPVNPEAFENQRRVIDLQNNQ